MATVESRTITAEEFRRMADRGRCELVKGRVVPMNPPGWKHGHIASRINGLLDRYLQLHDLGRAAINDAGIVTQHNPDTVRGADVLFHSYSRLPRELEPDDYPELAPEIVWEVLSPGNRWKDVLAKVAEYLEAGVLVVCVIDLKNRCLITYYPDRVEEKLVPGDVWREPAILPGFELNVEQLVGRPVDSGT